VKRLTRNLPALLAELDRAVELLGKYMSAFGQGLEAHGIPLGEQQVDVDAEARAFLKEMSDE